MRKAVKRKMVDIIHRIGMRQDDYTILVFGHRNWREAVEFTAHCSMKWAGPRRPQDRQLELGVA
jgi:hypothetical protein